MTDDPSDDVPPLDDAAAEQWLGGGAVPAGFERTAAVLQGLVVEADRTVPAPSPALADLLATPAAPALGPSLAQHRRRRQRGLATAGIVTVLGLTGATAAAASGVLPRPAGDLVSGVVRTVTPFSLPDRHPHDAAPSPSATPTSVRSAPPSPVGPQPAPRSTPSQHATPPSREGATSHGGDEVQEAHPDEATARPGAQQADGPEDARPTQPAASPQGGDDVAPAAGSTGSGTPEGSEARPQPSPSSVEGGEGDGGGRSAGSDGGRGGTDS